MTRTHQRVIASQRKKRTIIVMSIIKGYVSDRSRSPARPVVTFSATLAVGQQGAVGLTVGSVPRRIVL